MKHLPLVVGLVATASAVAACARARPPQTADPASIPNYTLVSPSLAAAGQPSPQTLSTLEDMGFRTVINLRTEAEGAPGERAVVESQGLRYVWVPITPDSFSLADVEAVEKVLGDRSAAPVLLHCASSNRVGGVWAAVQARRGTPLDEALAAGREAGLKSPAMESAVRRVLGSAVPSQP